MSSRWTPASEPCDSMIRRQGNPQPRVGFTLIEVLVVVAIIGLLIALILPAVQSAREAARRVHCLNNLHQMGIAMHAYHEVHESFPCGLAAGMTGPGTLSNQPCLGWAPYLFPYLEQSQAYNALNLDLNAHAVPQQSTAFRSRIDVLLCPSDARRAGRESALTMSENVGLLDAAPSNYVGSSGELRVFYPLAPNLYGVAAKGTGVFYLNSGVRIANVIDGLSSTLCLGERASVVSRATWVGAPLPASQYCTVESWPHEICMPSFFMVLGQSGSNAGDLLIGPPGEYSINSPGAGPDSYSSSHAGGSNFLFADGSARLLRQTIHPGLLSALGSIGGGEIGEGNDRN
jgi:prepilin-type N-terminal cleavage/methylation domain-containing protein/prepilin-type processing-associated H-X9-DG protein